MTSFPTIYLTGHNNFGNRGCEALVRSTVLAVRRLLPDAHFLVPSNDIARDAAQWPQAAEHGVTLVAAPRIGRRFVQWSRVCRRLPFLAGLPWPRLAAGDPLRRQLEACHAVLSIGGDNYSLDYDIGSLAFFVAVAEAALDLELPVLLWGASVGPFTAKPAVERVMAAHLRRLAAITARESHSVAYLHGLGLGKTLHSVADSAFLLRPEAFDTTSCWPQGGDGVVGLNLSPLIDRVRQRAGAATALVDEAASWVRTLVATSQFGVLLVPHVAPLDGGEINNDERFLARVQLAVADLGPRVQQLPGGLNAAQIKHAIAACRFFIGARTHATIAAMSGGVPTLSIAYSVKARGINLDLFGDERYVLDTRHVSAATLADGLALLRRDEAAIRALYEQRLPQWRQRAGAGADVLVHILESSRVVQSVN